MPKLQVIFEELLSLAHGDLQKQRMSRSLPSSLIIICYNHYMVHYNKRVLM